MKKSIMMLTMFFVMSAFGISPKDKVQMMSDHKNDQAKLMKDTLNDLEIKKIERVARLVNPKSVKFNLNTDCDEDNNTGAGSQSCWERCDSDGYSTSYCSNLCGTSTSGGSGNCWEACDNDGYSTSYCANLCGTTTSGGSGNCWEACDSDGYSTSYCANLCGTTTSGGSGNCWEACNSDGYSTSYCANLCGTN